MSPDRWRKIEELYHAALVRPVSERGSLLAAACGSDEDLRREIESLLAQRPDGRILDTHTAELLPESASVKLALGAVLGQYRIVEHLGTGGMGTVYKASDTKLGRQVALKLPRPEMLEDSTALARFEREARTLASLNHSRIATIYGFEEHGGIRFLVLEYVAGATLAERLRSGKLPLRETVELGMQIAEALEVAHAQGIIHRDLKPANIKVNESGQVKVLDFGLAKWVWLPKTASVDSTATVEPTVTQSMMVVGTAAYMSPQQASGKPLDARTDIWAFGCVLYEALCGRRAFPGETLAEILAAVIEREPDWSRLPAGTPEPIESLLRRCLRKDPQQRLRDIGDARIELSDWLAAPPRREAPAAGVTRRIAVAAVCGAAAGGAATALFAISRYRGSVPHNLTRFSITVPEGDIIPSSFGRRIFMAPDGTRVGYVVTHKVEPNRFYLRSLGELTPRLVLDRCAFPVFSPDGQWIAFQRTGSGFGVMKMNLGGGAPVSLGAGQNLMSGTWAEDEMLYSVLLDTSGLAAIPVNGGSPREVLKVDLAKGERQPQSPHAIRGTDVLLLTVPSAETDTYDDARIVAFRPHTGERKTLVEGGANPRYSASGHLLFARDSKILAVRFDAKRLKVSGQPVVVLEGVQMSRNTGVVNYDVSTNGDLAYVHGICDGGARTLVWVDRNGNANSLGLPPRSYLHPRLSPDGRRLAVEVEGPNHDLYLYDFDRGVLAKITTDGTSHWPIWSPDGGQLAFRQGPMGRFKLRHVPVDRSAEAKAVSAEGVAQSPESWSPDGSTLAYTAQDPGLVPPRIMVVSLEGGPPRPLETSTFPEGSPKFSPDGRWVAYCSAESGKPQVYVQAYPGPGARIQVSSEGGTDPVWKHTGGELFYRNGDSMIGVAVSTAPTFRAGRPQELWKGHYSHGMSSSCGPPGTTSSNYDVTADGQRFLMIRDDDQDRAVSREIVVVLGFANELNRIA